MEPDDLLPDERVLDDLLPEEDLTFPDDLVLVERDGAADRVRVGGEALLVEAPFEVLPEERTLRGGVLPDDRTLRVALVPDDLTLRVALLLGVERMFRFASAAEERMLLPVVLVVDRTLVDLPDVTVVVVSGDQRVVVRSADGFNPEVGRVALPPTIVRPVARLVDPV